jgi:hypothetical protein
MFFIQCVGHEISLSGELRITTPCESLYEANSFNMRYSTSSNKVFSADVRTANSQGLVRNHLLTT